MFNDLINLLKPFFDDKIQKNIADNDRPAVYSKDQAPYYNPVHDNQLIKPPSNLVSVRTIIIKINS